MTPKEKAQELVDRFKNMKINGQLIYPSDLYCKQCALICVDEIMKAIYQVESEGGTICVNSISDWQEVKQEIEKL